jgi:hypothetical protein
MSVRPDERTSPLILPSIFVLGSLRDISSGVQGGDEAASDPSTGTKRGKVKKKASAGNDEVLPILSTPERPVKTPMNATPERQPRLCTDSPPRMQWSQASAVRAILTRF